MRTWTTPALVASSLPLKLHSPGFNDHTLQIQEATAFGGQVSETPAPCPFCLWRQNRSQQWIKKAPGVFEQFRDGEVARGETGQVGA